MKKKLIVTAILSIGTLYLTSITSPARAAKTCVGIDRNTACSGGNGADDYQIDWEATCGTVTLKGIGICAFTHPTSFGPVVNEVHLGGRSVEDNVHCWCKMTSPAISKWVFVNTGPSLDACTIYCAHMCQGSATTSDFRGRLFSGLTD